ncbi:hypothetical protein ACIQ64_17855 [Streptomyces sp. NPDC094473]|uniref:hypothetical protein n=1 Tax=unclassified Streptomyces TaxID=2593676 RepID=UPI002FC9E5D8|nr:hypothetical protein OG414_02515 [Streptomyces sp. NBC_01174]WSS80392.1 hypothetical protein OG414_36710 [Streptomyces sp. NBC_01174]
MERLRALIDQAISHRAAAATAQGPAKGAVRDAGCPHAVPEQERTVSSTPS